MHPVLLKDVNSINYRWWLYKSNLVKFLSASDLILAHLRDKNSSERIAMSDIEKTNKSFNALWLKRISVPRKKTETEWDT